MTASQSKSAFLYQEVRRALRSGRYVPGQRIDPAALADEFNASATPVRFALYRLVGEGLIADHGRNGLRVPLPNEVALRDQYDWMRRLLLMACAIQFAAMPAVPALPAELPAADDLARATWLLFDAIESKGMFSQYNAAFYNRNKAAMRRFLLEGRLHDRRLLDAQALSEFFERPPAPRARSYMRIIDLCRMENWLRHQP